MIDPWIWATGAVIVGLLSGVVGAALVRRIVTSGRDDRPEIEDAARASAIFIFLFFTAVGVIVAVAFTDRDSLRLVPRDLLSYAPHVLAAGLILIAGRAIAYAMTGVVDGVLEGSSPRMRARLAGAVRLLVHATAVVLALSQLGVETTILSIAAAAALFGSAAAFALVVGVSSRQVGGELAAGRYLQRLVRAGDRIEIDGDPLEVVAVHPATVELRRPDGARRHLPHSRLLAEGFVVHHGAGDAG